MNEARKTWGKTLFFLWAGPSLVGSIARAGDPTTGGSSGELVVLYTAGRIGSFCLFVSLTIGLFRGNMSDWNSFQTVMMAVFLLTTFFAGANLWAPFVSLYEKYKTIQMLYAGKTYDDVMDYFLGKRHTYFGEKPR